MRRISALAIAMLASFLIACGGGVGSESAPPSQAPVAPPSPPTTPQPSGDNLIQGLWFLVYEENQCIETYNFREDGTFEINSGEAFIEGQYTFIEAESGRHEVKFSFEAQNSRSDCENSNGNIIGVTLSLFADFPSEFQLRLFETQTSEEAIFSLKLDNPIQITNLPTSIDYATVLNFKVNSERPFEEPPVLLKAPAGMEIDALGNVSYQPQMPMFDNNAKVLIRVGSSGSILDINRELLIGLPEANLPIVRTKSRIVGGDDRGAMKNLLVSGNFDASPEPEIVFLDESITFVTAEQNELAWKWTYPLDLPQPLGSLSQAQPSIRKFDTGTDGIDNVYASKDQRIFTLDSLYEKARLVYETTDLFSSFNIADFNSDGEPELILVKQDGSNEYTQVWDSAQQTILFQTPPRSLGEDGFDETRNIQIGNVDRDGQVEIVLPDGQVIDSLTGDIQWQVEGGFGHEVSLGDIDEDGILEILGHNRQHRPQVWDARSQSIRYSAQTENLGFEPICSIELANIDSTPDLELLYYTCGSRLDIYAISEDKLVLEDQLSLSQFRVHGIHVSDLDANGRNEVILNSKGDQSGVTLLEIEQDTLLTQRRYLPLQKFVAGAWAQVSPGTERAIFLAETENRSNHHIVQMNTNGELDLSELIFDLSSPQLVTVGDVNNDGFAEAIMTSTANNPRYSFALHEIDADQRIASYHFPVERISDNSRIELLDINNDGIDEALVASNDEFFIIDLSTNQIILQESLPRDQSILTDFDFAAKMNSQNVLSIALSSYSGTRVFTYENTQLNLVAENNNHCVLLKFLAKSGSLMCHGKIGSRKYLTVFDANHTEISVQDLASISAVHNYRDFVSIPGSDNVYASVFSGEPLNFEGAVILELNPYTQEYIWVSPQILGTSSKGSLNLIPANDNTRSRLFFSTEQGVYLSR